MPSTARLALCVAALCITSAAADDITWIDPAGGSWHDASNWSPARVPGTADAAVFTLPGAYTVALAADADAAAVRQSIGSVTLQLGGFSLRCSEIVFTNGAGTTPSLTLSDGLLEAGASLSWIDIDGVAGAPAEVRLLGAAVSALDVGASDVNITAAPGEMHGVGAFTNVSVVLRGPTASLSSTTLGLIADGAFTLIIEDGASAGGDTLSCASPSLIDVSGGGWTSWIQMSAGRLEVRSGGRASTDFGGGVDELAVSGVGSVVERIGAAEAIISGGGELRMDAYPFNGHAVVTGAGSGLRAWGVFGLVEVVNGGRLEEEIAGGLDIGGDVRVSGPGSRVVSSETWLYGGLELDDGATAQTGDIHMTDAGLLRVSGGSVLTAGIVEAGGATIVSGEGSRLSAGQITASSLLAAADQGRIAAPVIEIDGGRLAGNSVIEGDVGHANSSIEPSPEDATLWIDGLYTQLNTLCVYEASIGPDGRRDVLNVGAATLRGGLHLNFVDSYEPRLGDTFEILRASSITGRFDPALFEAPPMPAGLAAAVRYTPTAVTVAIVCRADLDGSGSLTLADFVAFRNMYTAGDLRADFDGGGTLTLADFVAFRNAYTAGCS